MIVSLKEIFFKNYHRQGAQLNQSNQNIEFVFGESNKYHQIGISYLEFEITVRKNDDTKFHYDDAIRLVNNGFVFCFKEALVSTTHGSVIEHSKFCGQKSTVMKVISNKADDLLSQFDNVNEMIFQSLRDLLTYHLKTVIFLSKKC